MVPVPYICNLKYLRIYRSGKISEEIHHTSKFVKGVALRLRSLIWLGRGLKMQDIVGISSVRRSVW